MKAPPIPIAKRSGIAERKGPLGLLHYTVARASKIVGAEPAKIVKKSPIAGRVRDQGYSSTSLKRQQFFNLALQTALGQEILLQRWGKGNWCIETCHANNRGIKVLEAMLIDPGADLRPDSSRKRVLMQNQNAVGFFNGFFDRLFVPW